MACIAAYLLDGFRKKPPPGCLPVLGRHQLAMAYLFLELWRTRRRWISTGRTTRPSDHLTT
ncbi:hypothetical protein [Lapillicoccus sp.]|uniref:hypothetical protein n=1 Tax=Lapillicoccus sp. TaxID=1909287 RepID=UPI00326686D2